MFKTVKRLLAQQTQWTETGQNLPATTPHWQPATAPAAAPLTKYPDVRRKNVNIDEVTQMVLTDLLRCPLQNFQIIESVGRVTLVMFEPYMNRDPVIPLPLINFGEGFRTEYRAMANEIIKFISDTLALLNGHYWQTTRPVSASLYYDTARYHMERALRVVQQSQLMIQEEWEYFNYQAWRCVAKPDLFLEYSDEKVADMWWKAVNRNGRLQGLQ